MDRMSNDPFGRWSRGFVMDRAPRGGRLLFGGLLSAVMVTHSSWAADSTVGVKAEVYEEACTVTAGASLEIDFGTLSRVVLQSAGSATTWVDAPKKIELSCPAGISKVTAKFDGTADAAATNTFKNVGTAKNVSIDLQTQGGEGIAPGMSQTVTVVAGAAEYALRARIYSKNGGAEAGTVSSAASFTLSYQ